MYMLVLLSCVLNFVAVLHRVLAGVVYEKFCSFLRLGEVLATLDQEIYVKDRYLYTQLTTERGVLHRRKFPILMAEPAPSSPQMVPTPSITNQESLSGPPGYFDIVPDSNTFFPPKYPQTLKRSTVKSKEKTKGVYSHDPILDKNPTELWRFLVSNLHKPHLAVHLIGTHTESRTRTVTSGTGSSRTTHMESYNVTVTDFSFWIDVSKHVIPQWTRIVAHRSRKASKGGHDPPTPTVRATLEEYTGSANPFKELRLEKFVVWDHERVAQLLTDLVRSTGYTTDVGVEFPMQDYQVVALASNGFSRAAHSTLVRVLCVVSCACIVCWPLWAMARKRMKGRLECEYRMAVSGDEFYFRNSASIHSAVVQRCISQDFLEAL